MTWTPRSTAPCRREDHADLVREARGLCARALHSAQCVGYRTGCLSTALEMLQGALAAVEYDNDMASHRHECGTCGTTALCLDPRCKEPVLLLCSPCCESEAIR